MSSLAEAKQLAAQGRFQEAGRMYESLDLRAQAVDMYKRGGLWREAGRLLVHEHKIREAADMFMRILPERPAPVGGLREEARKDAMHAAVCYARAGEVDLAAGIFLNLGETKRAAEVLQRAGRQRESERVSGGGSLPSNPWPPGMLSASPPTMAQASLAARTHSTPPPIGRGGGSGGPPTGANAAMGRGAPPESRPAAPWEAAPQRKGAEAAPRAVRAGEGAAAVEQAEQLAEAGRVDEAMKSFMSVPPDDPAYKKAAKGAIRLAWEYDQLNFHMDRWLEPYYKPGKGIRTERSDLMSLYTLGLCYESKDFWENAEAAFGAVMAIDPNYRDAAERMRRLMAHTGGGVMKKILDEDISFLSAGRRTPSSSAKKPPSSLPAAPLPDLPSLPSFGDLPSVADPSGDAATIVRPQMGTPLSSTDGSSATVIGVPPGASNPTFGQQQPGAAAPVPPSPSTQPQAAEVPRSAAEFGPGILVAERYRVEKMLGKGGMAAVYMVKDEELDEKVALKLFDRNAGDEEGLERFKQEMKICRRLVHPNIVRTYEFGVWQGYRFITMEIMRGQELEDMLKKLGKPMSVAQGVSLLMQACDGLGYAHGLGIFHRDVKGHNMFVVEEGKTLKVMDFGIAKMADNDIGATKTGMLVGTPAYMSPERLEGKGQLGPMSDIYALGVLMYQMFTAKLPFEAPEITTLMLRILREIPQAPSAINPDLPSSLERIIMKLLEKDPDDRYQTCADLKKELGKAWDELRRLGLDY